MIKKQQKVRDNCHYTGKYRDAAHNICNLRYLQCFITALLMIIIL